MSQPKPRTWTVEQRPIHDENGDLLGFDLDRNEVVEAYLECETIQRRLGGAIMVVPVRQQESDGSYRTTALRFRWESFVPALRQEQPAPEAQQEAEPEPALVEG